MNVTLIAMRVLKIKHTAIVESCFLHKLRSRRRMDNILPVIHEQFPSFLAGVCKIPSVVDNYVICNVKSANDDCCAWPFFRNSLDKSAIAIYNKNLRVSWENPVNLAYHPDIVIKSFTIHKSKCS